MVRKEIKVAHISGRYSLIGVVLSGIFALLTAFIGNSIGKTNTINETLSQIEEKTIDIDSIDSLINTYNQLVIENGDLKDTISELKYTNTELENENKNLLNENDTIKEQLVQYSSLIEENNTLILENRSLLEENNSLNNEIEQLKVELEDFTQNPPTSPLSTDKKISIFGLETFKGQNSWCRATRVYNYTDTYDNEYPGAYYDSHYVTTKEDEYKAPTYLLNKKYSICEGQIAWSKESKNLEGSAWIEFFSGDDLIYTTDPITADSKVLTFSFSVEGVEKLTIVKTGTRSDYIAFDRAYIIYPYLNLVE